MGTSAAERFLPGEVLTASAQRCARSTLVTSQLRMNRWHEAIGNPTLADLRTNILRIQRRVDEEIQKRVQPKPQKHLRPKGMGGDTREQQTARIRDKIREGLGTSSEKRREAERAISNRKIDKTIDRALSEQSPKKEVSKSRDAWQRANKPDPGRKPS